MIYMILSDQDLKYYLEQKKLVIEPLKSNCIRENGLDLSIDDEIAIEKRRTMFYGLTSMVDEIIDSHDEDDVKERFIKVKAKKLLENETPYFIIEPKTLNLLSTQEYVKFPDDLMGFCALRSSVARHGFIAPMTIIDAGFEGTLTIEVFYSGIRPFKLYVGDRFLHLIIAKTSGPVRKVYNGIYKGQRGVRIPKCLD